MSLPLVISIILLIGALIVRKWWLALGIYLLSGIFQIKHDKRIPDFNRPSYLFSPVSRYLMIVLWPVRLFAICQEYIHFKNERFRVFYGMGNKFEHKEFKTFKDATKFAREKTEERRKHVWIYDIVTNKEYNVHPSGKIEIDKE